MEFAPDGSHLLYSTYLGSSVSSMALDGLGTIGTIYAAISNYGDLFPIVPGSFGETTEASQLVTALSLVQRPPGSVSCVVSAASGGGFTVDTTPSLAAQVGLISVPAIQVSSPTADYCAVDDSPFERPFMS